MARDARRQRRLLGVLSARMPEAQRQRVNLICSLPLGALSAARWLLLVRRHWAAENNCRNRLDKALGEDDPPRIEKDPRGMLVVMMPRRIAYNMLASRAALDDQPTPTV